MAWVHLTNPLRTYTHEEPILSESSPASQAFPNTLPLSCEGSRGSGDDSVPPPPQRQVRGPGDEGRIRPGVALQFQTIRWCQTEIPPVSCYHSHLHGPEH